MKADKATLPEKYPKTGEVYKHYKGDFYKIIALALHANDHIWVVVYEPMYEDPYASCFVRPLSEWYDVCNLQDSETKVERFTLVV